MPEGFGTVAIPQQYKDESGLDLDALLSHTGGLYFYDERNRPTSWPAGIEGLVFDFCRVPAEVIDQLPDLKVASFAGTGVADWIDMPRSTERGVAVCNVPGWGSESIAEYTFAFILAVARKIISANEMAHGMDWREEACRGLQIRGKTLGLVGLGSIGQRVAEIAEGFDLKVLCYTRRPDLQRQTRARVEFVPLDELLSRSDILSLHVALNDQTRGMIGARELALLPQDAILINTARGPVVDTYALIDALKSGRLWGAAMDVFDQEPLPEDHPLRKLDNVIMSPHIAGQTEAAKNNLYVKSLTNIDFFAIGQPANVVNAEALAVRA